MEETNYDRPARPVEDSASTALATISEAEKHQIGRNMDKEPSEMVKGHDATNTSPMESETGQVFYPRKTYTQKLGIKDKRRPNRMCDIILAAFTGFSYPSVLYAGYVNLWASENKRMLTDSQFNVWRQ